MKPYAVEARIGYITNDTRIPHFDLWSTWNTYKSIPNMLQGLSDLRKNTHVSSWKTPTEGKMVLWYFFWQYRPVHSNLIEN